MRQIVCENITVPEGKFEQTVCLILLSLVYFITGEKEVRPFYYHHNIHVQHHFSVLFVERRVRVNMDYQGIYRVAKLKIKIPKIL